MAVAVLLRSMAATVLFPPLRQQVAAPVKAIAPMEPRAEAVAVVLEMRLQRAVPVLLIRAMPEATVRQQMVLVVVVAVVLERSVRMLLPTLAMVVLASLRVLRGHR